MKLYFDENGGFVIIAVGSFNIKVSSNKKLNGVLPFNFLISDAITLYPYS